MSIQIEILLSHKNNKILPTATIWMGLEGIMLSEISMTEKDKNICFYLYVKSKTTKETNKQN